MTFKKTNTFTKKIFAGLSLLLPVLFCTTGFFSCTKEEPRLMKVLNDSIADVSATTAKIFATVVDIGEGVDQYGQCWSKEENPTLEDCENFNVRGLLSETGLLVDSIHNLSSSSLYYIKSYLKNGSNVVYSNPLNFQTLAPTSPIVTTASVTAITSNAAQCGGNITSDGGAAIIARGVCWSISQNPTTENSKTNDGSGTGTFTSNLTSLSLKTTYYVRAYATNSQGTAYGNQVNFNTGQGITSPNVTTAPVTAVTSTTAQCGGNISYDGGAAVTARGVCWSTSQNPTIENSTTSDGSGTGAFTSNLTSLSENTTYYVRAYATNSQGTAYGNELNFKTGQKITMPTLTTTSASSITTNSAKSGGNISSDGGAPVTARGVCWSTTQNPTISDSKTTNGTGTGTFTSDLTGLNLNTKYYVRAYATNSQGTAYGNQVNFTTGQSITSPNVTTESVTAITTTTAQSGGNITSDGGAAVTARGVCWSTTQNPTISNSKTSDGTGTGSFTSILTGLTSNTKYYVRAYATNSQGPAYGVEQNFTTSQNITRPVLTTATVTSITTSSAKSGGNISGDGGAPVTARGVCWSTSQNPTISNSKTSDGTGTGTFISILTGLTSNTKYYVRAYATNSQGPAYGSEVYFTTNTFVCGSPFVDTRGGTYLTVMIGSQCWMAENINIGTRIDGASSQTNNGPVEKYCYDNLESNCDIYGGLYQWNEMMQYTTTESTQGICPFGWHVPSDNEWKILEMELGLTQAEANQEGIRGTDEGTKLKQGGSSGFDALMAGKCTDGGVFQNLGMYTTFWNSSGTNRTLSTEFTEINYSSYDTKNNGFSVRCVLTP
jgi:uncharacterized protein (TIGR02145 family)